LIFHCCNYLYLINAQSLYDANRWALYLLVAYQCTRFISLYDEYRWTLSCGIQPNPS
jgi:hypothetical protein